MKFPKHRANLYLVERWLYGSDKSGCTIVGGFDNYESAEDFCEACTQEWIDKGHEEDIINGHVVFNVVMTTYYAA